MAVRDGMEHENQKSNEGEFRLRLQDVRSGLLDEDNPLEDEESEDDNLVTLVTFKIEESFYALPIEHIHEVIEIGEIVRIPGAASTVEGVMNYREEILPVMSLHVKLGTDRSELRPESRVLVSLVEGMPLGFLVDAASSVLSVSREEIRNQEGVVQSGKRDHVKGVLTTRDGVLLVLGFETILSGGDLQEVERLVRSRNKGSNN